MRRNEMSKKNKFKVGDIIRGTDNENYTFTDKSMTKGLVTQVINDECIMVKILENKKFPYKIGRSYSVFSKYFEYIPNENIFNKFVEIINAPNGAKGINQTFGLIIDRDTANILLKQNFKEHGIINENTFYYFIPFKPIFKEDVLYGNQYNYKGEVWGLGDRFEDIHLKDVITGEIYNEPVNKMTVEEIERELGYKIKIVDKKENN